MIRLLLNQQSGVKLDLFTEILDVSNRTFYRELANLEKTLNSYAISIERDLKTGYYLVGTKEAILELEQEIVNLPTELSVQQRQSLLMIQLLLSKEAVKLEVLSRDLQVSISTIQADLEIISDIFREYNIEILRMKSKGIKVSAKESNLRLIIAGLISSEVNEYYFSQLLDHLAKSDRNSFWNTNENIFLSILNKKLLIEVYSVLKEFNQDLFTQTTDLRFQRIIILLTISMMRLKNEYFLEKDDSIIEVTKKSENVQNAQVVLENIQQLQPIQVTEEEVHFLALQLEGVNIYQRQDFFAEDYDPSLSFKVSKLIRKVSNRMEWNFNQDSTLYNDLLLHISGAVKRAVAPMPTNTDNIFKKINLQYKDLSMAVEKSLNEIFSEIDFSFEEIMYIVLHFASTYEKVMASPNISVLVICSSGVGMAKILKNKLKKNILEISNITTARVSELDRLDLKNYDLILSTIFLEGFELNYQLVTPLLMDDEVKSIRLAIQELDTKRKDTNQYLAHSTTEYRFNDYYEKMAMINNLLESFELSLWQDYDNLNDVIKSICSHLEDRGILLNPQKVTSKLLTRMHTAPIGFPNTNMALFHTIDKTVLYPFFGVYDIPKSFEINSFDKGKIKMNRILLMIGPNPLSKNAQEVLGLISSTIIESDLNLELFNTASNIMMINYLDALFLEHYKK